MRIARTGHEVSLTVDRNALVITPDGLQPLYLVGDDIPALLRSLADQFTAPGLVTRPGGRPESIVTKSGNITPLQVIEYFYNSGVLREHAPDVEELLSKSIPGYNRQLIADMKRIDQSMLFENGMPVRGIQSRIAEQLGVQNAGSDRRRVLAVLSELTGKYSTTTTAKSPEIAPQAA